MYHALLTNRYLTSRVIPLIAVAAVALCVALVIIVVSVMTGFLDMVKNSGRTLMGDVVISYQVSGIPYYERLIERIKQLPEAAAATPVVDGLGVLQMPYPDEEHKKPVPVYFWGIEPKSFAEVTGYAQTLYWRELTPLQRDELFNDVLEVHWKDVLGWFTEDQRVEFIRRAMIAESGDPSFSPDMTRIRGGVNALSEDAWQHMFLTLRDPMGVLKELLTAEEWQQLLSHDPRLLRDDQILNDGLSLTHAGDARAIVLGMHVSEGNERQRDGSYMALGRNWRWWMPRHQVTLTTIPISGGLGGKENTENRILQVVNEFVSGVFIIDKNRAMIPLSIAQDILHLDEAPQYLDPDDSFKQTGVEPARATMVLVRAADGVTPEQLREMVRRAYSQFVDAVVADPATTAPPPQPGFGLSIQTWAEQQASFIGPVEKEREMMRVLFSVVYLVCAGLVLSIFWAIVSEKTRDIGILRSVGAAREGVLWIFTRYGLMTGALGSLTGLLLGALIVNRINPIQDTLARPPVLLALFSLLPCVLAATWVFIRGRFKSIAWLALNLVALALAGVGAFGLARLFNIDPAIILGARWEFVLGGALIVVLACLFAFVNLIRNTALVSTFVGTLVFMVFLGLAALIFVAHKYGGFQMWNPEVYYFTEIPNKPDWQAAWGTVFLAIMFSVLGAAIAAAKAADTDPVQALRYE